MALYLVIVTVACLWTALGGGIDPGGAVQAWITFVVIGFLVHWWYRSTWGRHRW